MALGAGYAAAATPERVRALSAKVRYLADLEAILRIRCNYHSTLNSGGVGRHFDDCTENVICQWDEEIPPQVGRAQNQETACKVIATGITPSFRQSIHNHLIEIDGDSATATSHMDAWPVQYDRSVMVSSRWSDKYRREEGRWWIAEQRLKFYFQVFLDEGWAQEDRIFNPFKSVDIQSNEKRDAK